MRPFVSQLLACALLSLLVTSCKPDTEVDDPIPDAATCSKDASADCGVEGGVSLGAGNGLVGNTGASGSDGLAGAAGASGASMDGSWPTDGNWFGDAGPRSADGAVLDLGFDNSEKNPVRGNENKALLAPALLSFTSANAGRHFVRSSTATSQIEGASGIQVFDFPADSLRQETRESDPTDAPVPYLFEGARTNWARNATELGGTPWGQNYLASATSVNLGSPSAPDGTPAAEGIHFGNTTGATGLVSTVWNMGYPASPDRDITMSTYHHSGPLGFTVAFGSGGGLARVSGNFPPANDSAARWRRFDYPFAFTQQELAFPHNVRVRNQSPLVAGQTTILWGVQVEDGSFPSSFIRTPNNAVVARAADSLWFDAIPSAMCTARWQFDVYPEFGSEDGRRKLGRPLGLADQSFGLFSFGSPTDGIALYFDADGKSYVSVLRGGVPTLIRARWERQQRIVVTVDPIGGRVGVDGMWTQLSGGLTIPTGVLGVGALHTASGAQVANTNAFARISEPRPYAVACDAQNPCGAGFVCGSNNGWRFGVSGDVCWPSQECGSSNGVANYCGSTISPCGLCCRTSSDCAGNPHGPECGVGAGPRAGLEEGANICWSAGCNTATRDSGTCGSLSATCGLCPALETPSLVDFDSGNFERNSEATRLDFDETGKLVVETVESNELRTERHLSDDQGSPTLYLFEGKRTNFVRQSSELDGTTWSKGSLRTTLDPDGVAANTTVAPDGTQSAETTYLSSVGNGSNEITTTHYKGLPPYDLNNVDNVDVTMSMFRYSGFARFMLSSGALNVDGPTVPAQWPIPSPHWSRVTLTSTVSLGPNFNTYFRINPPFPLADSDLVAWGAQSEEGSFPSSYIPTSGVVATREADVFEFTQTPSALINGAWRFEVYPEFGSEDGLRAIGRPGGLNDRTFGLFWFKNAAGSETAGIGLRFDGAGRSHVRVVLDGVAHDIAKAWTRDQRIAIRLDLTAPRVFVDGEEFALGTTPYELPAGGMLVGSAYDTDAVYDPTTNAFARISEPRAYATGCTSAEDCAPGYECGANGERFGTSGNVCWPAALCSDPATRAAHCGSVDDPCGLCCLENDVGDDCATGEVCGVSNGDKLGIAAGANACWPAVCEQQVVPDGWCGGPEAQCGTCTVTSHAPFLAYRDGAFSRPGTNWWDATSLDFNAATGSLVVRNWKDHELRTERRPSDAPGAPTLYLLEGATNVYTRISDDMENSYWARESLVPAADGDGVLNNAAEAPDGTTFADVVQLGATAGSRAGLQVWPPYNPEVNWTASVFHHDGAGILRLPRMGSSTYTDVALVPSAAPKWQRFDVRHRSGTGGAAPRVYLQNTQTNPTAHNLTAWGIQVEAGNFPTSFVRTVNPTNWILLVRSADVLTFPSVPAEMLATNAAWSVDVYPLHGSGDGQSATNPLGLSNVTYGLFAFGGTGASAITDHYLALYYNASGASQLRVVQGTSVTDIPVQWDRHQRLTLTVKPGVGIGLGDVWHAMPSLAAPPAGRMMVGGLFAFDGTQAPNTSAFARISEPRLAVLTGCTSDSQCRQGEVCGAGNGVKFGTTNANVCWPAICESNFAGHCGSVNSECGTCCGVGESCSSWLKVPSRIYCAW